MNSLRGPQLWAFLLSVPGPPNGENNRPIRDFVTGLLSKGAARVEVVFSASNAVQDEIIERIEQRSKVLRARRYRECAKAAIAIHGTSAVESLLKEYFDLCLPEYGVQGATEARRKLAQSVKGVEGRGTDAARTGGQDPLLVVEEERVMYLLSSMRHSESQLDEEFIRTTCRQLRRRTS
ncbi:MAG: hypothetical protein KY452_01565 [Actinobacteria bacterium]|nr:hypothetical protein [Actinomycetota bacterium]